MFGNFKHGPSLPVHTSVQNEPIYFFVAHEHEEIQKEHAQRVFYEREELEIIATHFKGGTFVDIGANVGNHSIFAAKFLGASKVIAFEPSPTAYVIFKCNIALNDLESRIVHHAVGLSDVTFHTLRHTHFSQSIDAGVDIVTISKRLGHAKPDITLRIYAHLFRKDDSKAAAAINAAFKC